MQPWDAHEFPKNNLPTYFYHDCHSNCAASGSIDWFRNQICLTLFLFKVSPSKRLFKPLLGLVWRGPSRLYKMLVPACVATKCNAHAWQRWSGKIAASKGVPRTTPRKMPITHTCFLVERNSEHGFLELGWNSTIGQKEQEHIRIGYTWIGTKKKWNKSEIFLPRLS